MASGDSSAIRVKGKQEGDNHAEAIADEAQVMENNSKVGEEVTSPRGKKKEYFS